MLQKFIASRLITPPAIWGKLPSHADFVRSEMRHGDSEGWQQWLARQGCLAGDDAFACAMPVPIAFVLPAGELAFAPRHFVIGVVAPSMDRVGRRYPLLVYQRAHPGWVRRHFEAQAHRPQDWLFWLSRAVTRHTSDLGASDILALRRTVQALWCLYEPGWMARHGHSTSLGRTVPIGHGGASVVLDQVAGPAPATDPAVSLHGVRFLPWADWPRRLHNARAESAFWQQDARGGFINAATRLQALWGGPP